MKKSISCIAASLIVVFIAASLIGCASARQLVEKGDVVTAIEKLAKSLTKKSTNQDDADLFISVYASAVDQRRDNPETVSDVVSSFISSKGASNLSAALDAVQASLASGGYIGDESSVRSAVTRAENAYIRAEDLYRIQKAVKNMPYEIGDPYKGEVYYVEKYSDDFAGRYQIESRDVASFIYSIAEAGYPGTTVNQMRKGFDLYEKAAKYNATIKNDCTDRQASLAYGIGDLLSKSSGISDKKDAISWFKKCDTKKSGYSDVKSRILGCNYDIGEIYLDRFKTSKSRTDIKEAISYFRDAKEYKDAPSKMAYCEVLLDELDNPQPPAEELTAVNGEISYSSTSPVATIPIKISGADHLFTSKEFKITKTSYIQKVEIEPAVKEFTPGVPVTYIATVSGIIGYGTVAIYALDKNGETINPLDDHVYTIDPTKVFVPPTLKKESLEYSKTDTDVTARFVVRDLKKKLSLNDIVVKENKTGSKLAEVRENGKDVKNYPVYEALFEGVTESGNISLSILGDDGTAITADDGTSSISFFVELSKVYKAPDPNPLVGKTFYSYSMDTSIQFKASTVVYGNGSEIPYEINVGKKCFRIKRELSEEEKEYWNTAWDWRYFDIKDDVLYLRRPTNPYADGGMNTVPDKDGCVYADEWICISYLPPQIKTGVKYKSYGHESSVVHTYEFKPSGRVLIDGVPLYYRINSEEKVIIGARNKANGYEEQPVKGRAVKFMFDYDNMPPDGEMPESVMDYVWSSEERGRFIEFIDSDTFVLYSLPGENTYSPVRCWYSEIVTCSKTFKPGVDSTMPYGLVGSHHEIMPGQKHYNNGVWNSIYFTSPSVAVISDEKEGWVYTTYTVDKKNMTVNIDWPKDKRYDTYRNSKITFKSDELNLYLDGEYLGWN